LWSSQAPLAPAHGSAVMGDRLGVVEQRRTHGVGAVREPGRDARYIEPAVDDRDEDDTAAVHVESLLDDDLLGDSQPVAWRAERTRLGDRHASIVEVLAIGAPADDDRHAAGLERALLVARERRIELLANVLQAPGVDCHPAQGSGGSIRPSSCQRSKCSEPGSMRCSR
jgi:hypothetical protein